MKRMLKPVLILMFFLSSTSMLHAMQTSQQAVTNAILENIKPEIPAQLSDEVLNKLYNLIDWRDMTMTPGNLYNKYWEYYKNNANRVDIATRIVEAIRSIRNAYMARYFKFENMKKRFSEIQQIYQSPTIKDLAQLKKLHDKIITFLHNLQINWENVQVGTYHETEGKTIYELQHPQAELEWKELMCGIYEAYKYNPSFSLNENQLLQSALEKIYILKKQKRTEEK